MISFKQISPYQSVYDLAIQYYGSVEAVNNIILLNSDLNFEDTPVSPSIIKIDDQYIVNSAIVEYFKKNDIVIATSSEGLVITTPSNPVNCGGDYLLTNSDQTLSIIINEDYELPDISIDTGNGVVITKPSAVDFYLNYPIHPLKTGETVSYLAGDDGDIQAGREIDFYTLADNNPFGNTIRFTNDIGGIVFDGSDGSTPDYVVDNATRLGWKQSLPTGVPHYTNQLNYASSLVIGSYNNFRLANLNEYVTVVNDSLGIFRPDNTIFTFTGSYSWINQMQNSSTAYRAIYNSSIGQRGIYSGDANARGMYCRNHEY